MFWFIRNHCFKPHWNSMSFVIGASQQISWKLLSWQSDAVYTKNVEELSSDGKLTTFKLNNSVCLFEWNSPSSRRYDVTYDSNSLIIELQFKIWCMHEHEQLSIDIFPEDEAQCMRHFHMFVLLHLSCASMLLNMQIDRVFQARNLQMAGG